MEQLQGEGEVIRRYSRQIVFPKSTNFMRGMGVKIIAEIKNKEVNRKSLCVNIVHFGPT